MGASNTLGTRGGASDVRSVVNADDPVEEHTIATNFIQSGSSLCSFIGTLGRVVGGSERAVNSREAEETTAAAAIERVFLPMPDLLLLSVVSGGAYLSGANTDFPTACLCWKSEKRLASRHWTPRVNSYTYRHADCIRWACGCKRSSRKHRWPYDPDSYRWGIGI